MTDKNLPPANIEAEESILGSLLFDPKAIDRIKDWLPVPAFYVSAHQIIYQACLVLCEKDVGCDFIHLSDWLATRQILDDVGGTTKLAQLLNRTVSSVNLDRYAMLVLKKYQRRQIITLGHQIVEFGHDPYLEVEDIYEKIKEQLPDDLKEDSIVNLHPGISKAVYRVYNSNNASEQIELTADLTESIPLEDAMLNIKIEADKIAESIWGEKGEDSSNNSVS